jgi:hypothetical protein
MDEAQHAELIEQINIQIERIGNPGLVFYEGREMISLVHDEPWDPYSMPFHGLEAIHDLLRTVPDGASNHQIDELAHLYLAGRRAGQAEMLDPAFRRAYEISHGLVQADEAAELPGLDWALGDV